MDGWVPERKQIDQSGVLAPPRWREEARSTHDYRNIERGIAPAEGVEWKGTMERDGREVRA
jgi:hypothetical protein